MTIYWWKAILLYFISLSASHLLVAFKSIVLKYFFPLEYWSRKILLGRFPNPIYFTCVKAETYTGETKPRLGFRSHSFSDWGVEGPPFHLQINNKHWSIKSLTPETLCSKSGQSQGWNHSTRGPSAPQSGGHLFSTQNPLKRQGRWEGKFALFWTEVWTCVQRLKHTPPAFSSRVNLFPFPGGQFLELWQLTSWLWSGHRVVTFLHLVGASVSMKQHTACGSEFYLQPLRRN